MAIEDEHRARSVAWLAEEGEGPASGLRRVSLPDGMPRPGDVVANKYRIDELIGQGGMGAVYRATHLVIRSSVAVKWLIPDHYEREDSRLRFVREAQAAARIRHPNVVQVYDVGEQNDALYMVMELLEGEPLDVIIERGNLPVPVALQVLVQAMWGVSAAHECGIIHRDIKPENIYVVRDARQPSGLGAKVLDFGISKLSDASRPELHLTRSGMSLGTPAYMSCEQINGARDVDVRADVYAFGVLLYRMLTGRLPFAGETFGAMAVAIATQTPPSPRELRPELPGALSDLVVKAMARRPEERFATVQSLSEELEVLSTTRGYLGEMTRPPTTPDSVTPTPTGRVVAGDDALSEATRRPRRARALFLASGICAFVAAAGVLGYAQLLVEPELAGEEDGGAAAEVRRAEEALEVESGDVPGADPASSVEVEPPATLPLEPVVGVEPAAEQAVGSQGEMPPHGGGEPREPIDPGLPLGLSPEEVEGAGDGPAATEQDERARRRHRRSERARSKRAAKRPPQSPPPASAEQPPSEAQERAAPASPDVEPAAAPSEPTGSTLRHRSGGVHLEDL